MKLKICCKIITPGRVNEPRCEPKLAGQFSSIVMLCLSCTASALAGPVKSPPQTTRSAPAISQNSAATIQPVNPNRAAVQTAPAAQPVYLQADPWTERVGGAVFSTGADDVIVRIRSVADSQPVSRIGDRTLNPSPWTSGIYLVSPPPVRLIGSNRQGGREVNLGKLSSGELIFAVGTTDGYTLRTGDATRNPDTLYHAITRTYLSGMIEIWFEDAPGPLHWPGGRSDRNFTDAAIQLRGGVSDTGAVADLLKVIREQKGEVRQAALDALTKIDPKAAALSRSQ